VTANKLEVNLFRIRNIATPLNVKAIHCINLIARKLLPNIDIIPARKIGYIGSNPKGLVGITASRPNSPFSAKFAAAA
jgi:hypothetical protein